MLQVIEFLQEQYIRPLVGHDGEVSAKALLSAMNLYDASIALSLPGLESRIL